jgi:putative heme transporter
MVKRILGLLIFGLVLYGVAPAVLQVFNAWPQVVDIEPYWFVAMIAAQLLSWGSMWLLQRLSVDARSWWPVVTSNLASGAFGRVVPGGAAAAGALQYGMLVQAGVPSSLAGIGIGVASIVLLATLAALPVLAVPAILLGVAVPTRLWQAALVGVAVFAALLAIGATLLASDRAVRGVARAWIRIGSRLRPRKPPPADLPERLRDQRDLVRSALGSRWWEAVVGAAGRWLFDWLTLLTALAAVGQHPRPTLVLLAFCASQLLAQVPITPGGLGVVEAGLTGTLVLIGVPAGAAAVATLAYRLVSYWLALPAGGAAYLYHRRRVRAGDVSVPRLAQSSPGQGG